MTTLKHCIFLMRQYVTINNMSCKVIIIVTVTLYCNAFLPGRISVHRYTRFGVAYGKPMVAIFSKQVYLSIQ